MTIGDIAKHSGFSIDTIRFYERKGLLAEPERSPSGYRHYQPDTLVQLRFIRRAKYLGFTLEEITELLSLSQDNSRGVKGVKERAQAHLGAIEERINELTRVKNSLEQMVDACPGHGATSTCPILRALTDEEHPLEKG